MRAAKVQACSHDRMYQSVKDAGDPGHGQENTYLGVHDDRVTKWVADGSEAIKSHNSKVRWPLCFPESGRSISE